MEEEKAAAYYDELTRKGEGAARFKQGLGFSSSSASNDAVPKPGSALPSSSSSFLSQFVKASSSSTYSDPPEPDKKAQLQSIQDKLRKKPASESRVSEKTNCGYSSGRERDGDRSRRRSRSRERYRERGRDSRRRSRSRERYRHRDRDHRDRDAARSRSDSDGDRDRDRRQRERERGRRRSRSRSVSPPRKQRDAQDRGKVSEMAKGKKNAPVDYTKLIEGYDNMVLLPSILLNFIVILFLLNLLLFSRFGQKLNGVFFHFME